MCICSKDGNIQWAADHFGDCLYTTSDLISFLFGYISCIFFFVALYPQIYHTYKRKDVSGLSFHLLCIWAAGDTFNFLGATMTHQLFTQKLAAAYFIFLDITMISQYLIYRKPLHHIEYTEISNGEDHVPLTNFESPSVATPKKKKVIASALILATFIASAYFLIEYGVHMPTQSITETKVFCDQVHDSSGITLGVLFSWISGSFYFVSRIPQIWENYQQKSVEALSPSLFIFSILGNLSYGASIIFRFPDINARFYLEILPFLIGSLGTLIFDFLITYQIILYRNSNIALSDGSD